MELTLTRSAANWFQTELGAQNGDAIRLFVRYGAGTMVHPGFSLGVSVEQPADVGASTSTDGIQVFVRDDDLWYFDGHDLVIDWDPVEEDLRYTIGDERV